MAGTGTLRLGIFGGTFNPPHIGHLVCAQEARWQLGLERVVLMPAGEAPHKPIERDPGAEERYEMCVLATLASDWLEVSRDELERPGPSYTVDTLRALRAAAPEDELELILGADQAAKLADWREPAEILRLAGAAVARRDGVGESEVHSAFAALERGDRVSFFDMPRVDVSSSDVRERVADGRPYRYLVPERVADRIAERGLYREGSA